MSFLYFDESIRENGDFIVGALVVSDTNLTPRIHARWTELGLNPEKDEYKSSATKLGNDVSQEQRKYISGTLQRLNVALTVTPIASRRELGCHCVDLVIQLVETGMLKSGEHTLFIDENIGVRPGDRQRLREIGISCHTNVDSRTEAGIQVADHAAHALGGMLLEELGVISKDVVHRVLQPSG